MTRRGIRTGIAEFFGGSTFDDVAQIYRPTPLVAAGLAGVRAYWTTRFEDQDYYTTLADDRLMGAVMCVHLPQVSERRIASGGPTSGIKSNPATVELWIFHRAEVPNPETAQADLDDLIDAVLARFHGDRTLGGAAVEAGAGGGGITTRTGLPVVEPSVSVMQEAVITFEATLYPFV